MHAPKTRNAQSLIHAALPAIFGWGKVTGQGQGAQGGQAQYYHMGGGDQYGGGGGGGVPF